MSIDNGTCQLSFPMKGPLPAADVYLLRDVEVVGVGALRRRQLEELKFQNKRIHLLTHESKIPSSVFSIYQAELLTTLQWLRPEKVERKEALDFQKEQEILFSKLFPLTEKALGFAAHKVRDSYLQEMEWSSWLLQDHWRYFVGYLRQKFPDNKTLREVAHWEWVLAWLEIQPFEAFSGEVGVLTTNPSLQIVALTEVNSVLKRDKGLYAFVYNDKKATVVERSLDAVEAKAIDLLQEDRKYTPSQLADMLAVCGEITTSFNKEDWQKKFLSLCEAGIISLSE